MHSAEKTPADAQDLEKVNRLFDELFPICRSILGPGLRESLSLLRRIVPLEIEAVPSGEKVFDWTVPDEWHIQGAKLTAPDGSTVADFDATNLAVVNYSQGIDARLDLRDLKPYLHSIAALPDATPYVTSYYKRTWGFCLPHSQLLTLTDGTYHAKIDASFVPGELNYGHCFLEGETEHEFLLSSYLCHPSLANNELSGPLVLALLYERLAKWKRRRLRYRFVVGPETIGSICYLHRYGRELSKRLVGGLVLTCLGGPATSLSFKSSRRGDAMVNRVTSALVPSRGYRVRPFTPCEGSDERQYCSPGFNLPVGQFARTVYGDYDGYHNSRDTKEFMDPAKIVDSVNQIEDYLANFEASGYFENLKPYGEVQLGRRDLYPNMNSASTVESSSDSLRDGRARLNAILMILNYSDGHHSMIDIAEKLNVAPRALVETTERLEREGLLTLRGFHQMRHACGSSV